MAQRSRKKKKAGRLHKIDLTSFSFEKISKEVGHQVAIFPKQIEDYWNHSLLGETARRFGLENLQLPLFSTMKKTGQKRKKRNDILGNLDFHDYPASLKKIAQLGQKGLKVSQKTMQTLFEVQVQGMIEKYLNLPSRQELQKIQKQLHAIEKRMKHLTEEPAPSPRPQPRATSANATVEGSIPGHRPRPVS